MRRVETAFGNYIPVGGAKTYEVPLQRVFWRHVPAGQILKRQCYRSFSGVCGRIYLQDGQNGFGVALGGEE